MTETRSRVDHARHTIVFQRTLPAPREDVFDAWTRPEELTEWWDPDGRRLVECKVDLRVGGAFRFVNDGHAPPFEGVYRVVNRPAELVFDAMGAVGTVAFAAEGSGTRLTVEIRCASAEHLEMFTKLGVKDGTDRTLDNLVARITRRAA